jgi:hypothetical protein
MYDVVWYSPERRSDAEKVLLRLDLAEAIDRQCGDLRLSHGAVTIPGQTGVGRAACRNFLGAEGLALGSPEVASLCVLTDHGPGLVGGMLNETYILSERLGDDAEEQAQREIRVYQAPPVKSHTFAGLAWASLISCVSCAVAAVLTLPRYLKRTPVRRLRSLAELEAAAGQLVAEATRGIR